ncbi:MAG: inositol monophosphatase family protein [Patescibacteria group bacterium]
MNQDINSRIKKVTSLLKPAGDIFMRWLDEDNLGIEEKEKNDFVTLADKEIEQFLSREIMTEFPQDSIIREVSVSAK